MYLLRINTKLRVEFTVEKGLRERKREEETRGVQYTRLEIMVITDVLLLLKYV